MSTTKAQTDVFLEVAMPILARPCGNHWDNREWCATHESHWLRSEHCSRYAELRAFAERVIEAWERRAQ